MNAAAKTLKLVIFCQSNNGLKCAVSPLPNKTPKKIIPKREPIFRVVKIFWVIVPGLTPKQCKTEIARTTATEKRFPTVPLIGKPGMAIEKIASLDPRMGKKKDIKPLNPTARNAMAPENVTRNDDHPERNPKNCTRKYDHPKRKPTSWP